MKSVTYEEMVIWLIAGLVDQRQQRYEQKDVKISIRLGINNQTNSETLKLVYATRLAYNLYSVAAI